MADISVYLGLFMAAFLAATLLPMQSEAVLVGLLLTDTYPVWRLVLVAAVGNTLGSLLNWLLGRYIEHFHHHPWFPASPAQLKKAQGWYQKYGRWSLLLSWVPIIGDPLTVIAGTMREPIWFFIVIVATAKTLRYIALTLATLGVMP